MAACVRAGDEVDGSCSGEEEAAENREQQAVEVETLQSIFSEEITIIRKGAEFLVKVTPNLETDVQLILPHHNTFPAASPTDPQPLSPTTSSGATSEPPHQLSTHTSVATDLPRVPTTTTVTHLPPLTLFVRYHPAYPSRKPPFLHLSARWLDNRLAQFAVEHMQQMFTADCPVVFDWINYLQDEFLLEYAKQQQQQLSVEMEIRALSSERSSLSTATDTLRSSTNHQSSTTDQQHSLAEGEKNSEALTSSTASEVSSEIRDTALSLLTPSPSDPERHPCQIFLRSVSQLNDVEEFNGYECHREFLQTKHECGICFVMVSGEQFSEPCPECGVAFCTDCLLSYCQTRIGEGQVSGLDCPTSSCSQPLSLPLLEALLPPDLLERYIHLHEEVQLDSIPGMVFCPRSMCGSRVVSEPDSDLAVCTECGFPFCKLCKQTWHGSGVCPSLSKVEALQKTEEEKGGKAPVKKEKDAVEERRKLEELKSLVWMRSNTSVKPCPQCGAAIQKTGGCNKMSCTKCGSYFCWICGKRIAGYSHFNDAGCTLFRIQDYAPAKETHDVRFPKNQRAVENALMSECPRCQHTETKSNTNSNWLSCSRCKFQYCHWCLEPCFGAWHFSDYGCKQFTNMQQDLNHFNKMAREQKHQEQQNQEQQHREQQHEEED